jgi:tryptophanyl-tRNA synthetase
VVRKFEDDFKNGTIRYGDMKKKLAEDMVQFIAPIREKTETIRNDNNYMKNIMEMGSAKARKSAQATMKLVKEVMDLNYF